MRRTGLVLAPMALALLLASGVALAEVFVGDEGDNNLVGTDGRDRMSGGGGDDTMRGLDGPDRMRGGDDSFGEDGNDTMYGGRGQDVMSGDGGVDLIFGGRGDDYISSIEDDARDFVDCGPGNDAVNQEFGADLSPRDVFRNCEHFVA